MSVIREDFDGYYTLQAVDDRGRVRFRRDGTPRFADSRLCKHPELEIEKPYGAKPLTYSSRGIV